MGYARETGPRPVSGVLTRPSFFVMEIGIWGFLIRTASSGNFQSHQYSKLGRNWTSVSLVLVARVHPFLQSNLGVFGKGYKSSIWCYIICPSLLRYRNYMPIKAKASGLSSAVYIRAHKRQQSRILRDRLRMPNELVSSALELELSCL